MNERSFTIVANDRETVKLPRAGRLLLHTVRLMLVALVLASKTGEYLDTKTRGEK